MEHDDQATLRGKEKNAAQQTVPHHPSIRRMEHDDSPLGGRIGRPVTSMEQDFLGGFSGSATTTTMAAADMDGAGSATRQALARRVDNEPRPQFASAPPSAFQRHADAGADNLQPPTAHGHQYQLQQAPNGGIAGQSQAHALAVSPPQDARGFFFAASARGNDWFGVQPSAVVAAGAGLTPREPPVHHAAAAINAPRSKAAPAAQDHSTAKVTITCADGTDLVLENVPTEMVEQFVLSVGKETGAATAQHAHQPEPPPAFSSRTQMMALFGIMPKRAASLARFLDKRKKRSRANANNLGFEIERVVATARPYPQPQRDCSTAGAAHGRNKSLLISTEQPGPSGTKENQNYDYDDNDALDTELKI